MKEKAKKQTQRHEANAIERYIFEQAKKYMVAVRKFDGRVSMDEVVAEVRCALNTTWGWLGRK